MPILKGKQQQAAPAKANPAANAGKAVQNRPAPQQQKAQGESPEDAFAKRYAATDAAAGGGYVPPPVGQYNALITEAQGVIDGKASSAYLELTIHSDTEGDETVSGKTCRMYFNFTDENGMEGTGFPYFKSAMTQLGYPDDFQSWQEMCDALANIAANEVWAIIDVKKKGKWTNIFLDSVPENQDEKPAF